MRVLGADCSSKLIACVLLGDNNFFKSYLMESKNSDWDIRSRELFDQFFDLTRRLKDDKIEPDIVYIEQAIFLQNIKATLIIDSVINAVKFISHMNNIPYIIVDNKSWKKSVIGNGKASKEQIMEWAKVGYGDKITTQDTADACAIATFGRLSYGR